MRPLIIMHGEKIDWHHTVIRMLMYLAGVAVLALGMSLQTASGLGVAALTCFATTLSMLTGKTLGFGLQPPMSLTSRRSWPSCDANFSRVFCSSFASRR